MAFRFHYFKIEDQLNDQRKYFFEFLINTNSPLLKHDCYQLTFFNKFTTALQYNLHWLLQCVRIVQHIFPLWADSVPNIGHIYCKVSEKLRITKLLLETGDVIQSRSNENLLMMIGVSLSRARMHVMVTAVKLDRSKFVKQFRMIGVFCIFVALMMSITFCDTPMIFPMELEQIENGNFSICCEFFYNKIWVENKDSLLCWPLLCLQNGDCSANVCIRRCNTNASFDDMQTMLFG